MGTKPTNLLLRGVLVSNLGTNKGSAKEDSQDQAQETTKAEMTMWRSLTVLFILVSGLKAQTVKLPAEVKADVGVFVVVKADTDCVSLRWVALDSGLSLIPPELLKDSRQAVVMAGRAGKYRLLAYGALKDMASDPVICTVIVGTPEPPVPPVPPTPVDPFAGRVKSAYLLETDTDRARILEGLVSVYRQGVEFARNRELVTWGQLFAALAVAAESQGIKGKLPVVQGVIQQELKSKLPGSASTALDDNGRRLASNTFSRVLSALEEASK